MQYSCPHIVKRNPAKSNKSDSYKPYTKKFLSEDIRQNPTHPICPPPPIAAIPEVPTCTTQEIGRGQQSIAFKSWMFDSFLTLWPGSKKRPYQVSLMLCVRGFPIVESLVRKFRWRRLARHSKILGGARKDGFRSPSCKYGSPPKHHWYVHKSHDLGEEFLSHRHFEIVYFSGLFEPKQLIFSGRNHCGEGPIGAWGVSLGVVAA